jgi:hypothetical protein
VQSDEEAVAATVSRPNMSSSAALITVWATGMALGTYMVATQGLVSSIYPLTVFGVIIPGYAALYSVLLKASTGFQHFTDNRRFCL